MYREFSRFPNYMAKYHLKWTGFLVPVNLVLGAYFFLKQDLGWETLYFIPSLILLTSVKIERVIMGAFLGLVVGVAHSDFQIWYMLGLPMAFIMGLSFSGLIHCASHGSLRPRFLNRPVGELLGLLQLSGFADWKIVHILHHSHTDDPVRDPHPPQNLSYWDYTKNMRLLIVKAYVAKFFQNFGQTPESTKALKNFSRNSRLAHMNKVLFWFLLLKPQLFVFLFVPSIVSKMFQFSWLNWAAHRPGKEGVEIRNLEKGVYPVLNFFSFGLYVHGNHHLAPTLFNPKSYQAKAQLVDEKQVA